MADSDKDILITPQTGQTTDPSIVFSSGATGGDDVTLFVTDDGTITTLSIEGSAGQLLAISNDLTGTIFSVNDVSGIPSIEVDADGTISLAEFDGEVGIGTSAPLHLLHLEGRSPINTAAGIFIDSTGDAYLDLHADNTTGGAETNNPYVRFRQDQGGIEAVIGLNNTGDDALGNTFTGAGTNAFTIHHKDTTGTIALGVNGQVGLKIDNSDNVTVTNQIFPGNQTTGYIDAVTGDYGSIQVEGADGVSGTWRGYSIGGRAVFMDNAGTTTTNRFGIYNDQSNRWVVQCNTAGAGNDEATLYWQGAAKLVTASGGVTVTGTMAATSVTGDGSGLTSLTAANISSGSLASGVNLYQTAQSANSTYHVMFSGATTGVTTSGNYTANFDNGSGDFTYNPFTNVLSVGDLSSTTMQGLGYHASSGDAAPGADVWLRSNTSGYTYLGWINTTSGATTNVPDRIYTNQGGGDGFIRYQTVANFNTNVTSSASVGGDCTGTVGNIAVTNDSHTHAFNNLTSKASGTGFYATSGQFQAAAGLLGTYDDAPSSAWGGPIWGMDDGYTGPVGGANALATSTYGIRWNRSGSTQAHAAIGEGLYVYQNGALEGGIGTAGIYSAAIIRAAGNIYPGGQTVGYLAAVSGNYGSVQCNGADGSSGSYTGYSVEGELVFMLSGTTGGIYDDVNNEWKIRTDLNNAGVSLYYNGSSKLTTANDGIDVTGDVGGTSIGGITQANLVDKSATETITGTWTLDGVVTTADYGTGGRVKDGADIARPIGFNVMPVVSFTTTLTLSLTYNGGCYYHASATAHTVNVNNDGNIPTGATYMIRNWYQPTSTTVASGGTLTINPGTGVYLWWASGSGVPTGGTANRTLAGGGFCTLYKQSDTIWHIWGSGIT